MFEVASKLLIQRLKPRTDPVLIPNPEARERKEVMPDLMLGNGIDNIKMKDRDLEYSWRRMPRAV